MNDDDLRLKIYERLGLEVGSLKSESGNDWVRAEKEIISEYKQEQAEKAPKIKIIDYKTIDKLSKEFSSMINSNLVKNQGNNSYIATRNDLSDDDIYLLIKNGSKETIMNLVRYQKLLDKHIDLIIPNSVYLTKRFLIENQSLSSKHKEELFILMKKQPTAYKDIIYMVK